MELINKKIIILATICILIVLALPFGFSKIKNINAEVKNKSLQLNELKADLDSLDKLLEDSKNYSEKIDVIMNSLPDSYREVAEYTEKLEATTNENSQVLETTIDDAALDEKNSLASLKYSIKTSGNYLNYSNLLTDLSKLPYHTKVDSIVLDSSGGSVNTVTTYRLFLLNYKNVSVSGIPSLNTNLIDKIYKEIDENRLEVPVR